MSTRDKKILVVDDDVPSLIMLRGILHDYTNIFEARNGVEAMAFLERNPDTSLVILDYLMPDMDGLEVLARMRLSPYLANTCVLMLSGASDTELRNRALKLGTTDFANKPYHGPLLRQRVQNLLSLPLQPPASEPGSFMYQMYENSRRQGTGIAAYELKDDKIKHLYSNPNCAAIAGYTMSEYHKLIKEDSTTERVIHPDELGSFKKALETLAADRRPFIQKFRCQKKDGTFRNVSILASILGSNPEDPIIYIVIVPLMENVIDTASNIKPLLSKTNGIDVLTGVPDRAGFMHETRRMIDENAKENFVLFIADIDRFKVVNDLFGMKTGDNILVHLANRLRPLIAGRGTLGRIEPDKFAGCIMESEFDLDKLLKAESGISESLALHYNLTIHNGIYPVTEPTIEISQMCDRAKIALSSVKGNYIQRYAFYDESMRQAMLAEQQILNDMHLALEKGDFVIFLQPIYSLHFDKIVAAEALIRWKHPQHGLVAPGQFIPLFEKNRFITNLDHYMWEKTAAYLAKRARQGLPPIPISVNVSRMNLHNPNLTKDFTNLLERYHISSSLMRLEITESAYTDNPEQLIRATKSLRDTGFKILIDDFGSGYSSLKMLKDIPMDMLKIDMDFLDNLESSSRGARILLGVIDIAQKLGMTTIAEGVETKFQLDFLRTSGCDNIQGYYFSKPLPTNKFEKMLLNSPLLF